MIDDDSTTGASERELGGDSPGKAGGERKGARRRAGSPPRAEADFSERAGGTDSSDTGQGVADVAGAERDPGTAPDQPDGRVMVRRAAVVAVFQPPDLSAAPSQKQRGSDVSSGTAGAVRGEDESASTDVADGVAREEASKKRRRGGRKRRKPGDETESASGQEGPREATSEGGEAAGADGEQPVDETVSRASDAEAAPEQVEDEEAPGTGSRRRRRRRRGGSGAGNGEEPGDAIASGNGDVGALEGSTRLEAKRQRRRDGREAVRRRPQVLTEAQFLARRETVERRMLVKCADDRVQVAVLEDGVLAEHYVSRRNSPSMLGSIFLGRVQNVLPSMEAAFVDIGRGRNAVLYAGEVDWDAAGLEGSPRRIEAAMKPGDAVLVQVTKDPVGHKGARLTGQVSFAGRHLVLVPGRRVTGISRRLSEGERARLRKILQGALPDGWGAIVRTAAEGATEDQIRADIERLTAKWEGVRARADEAQPPEQLYAEPDLAIRVVRDVFNEDIASLAISGDEVATEIEEYVAQVSPELAERVRRWTAGDDIFTANRVDEQITKALGRRVWLPSGGSLVIDHTEAMTVVDVNTGKFTGAGGNLEETVTRNNLEAAEEVVRQLRLRDIGGIIVIDFIDMVLERNRQMVVRRLVECLGRDRTKHQVAEVTSLGLVQMTRKRIGQGLLETFSEPCEACGGRGLKVSTQPIDARDDTDGLVHRLTKAAGPIPGAPTPSSRGVAEEPPGDLVAQGEAEAEDEIDLDEDDEERDDEDMEIEGSEPGPDLVDDDSGIADGAPDQ